MEFKGTKDWEVQTYKTNVGFAIYSTDLGRCIAERWQDNISQKEHNKIAHLIAAAPDLLKELIELRKWVLSLEDWKGCDPPIESKSKAIEKALGNGK